MSEDILSEVSPVVDGLVGLYSLVRKIAAHVHGIAHGHPVTDGPWFFQDQRVRRWQRSPDLIVRIGKTDADGEEPADPTDRL